jgi:hypothetical protein
VKEIDRTPAERDGLTETKTEHPLDRDERSVLRRHRLDDPVDDACLEIRRFAASDRGQVCASSHVPRDPVVSGGELEHGRQHDMGLADS